MKTLHKNLHRISTEYGLPLDSNPKILYVSVVRENKT